MGPNEAQAERAASGTRAEADTRSEAQASWQVGTRANAGRLLYGGGAVLLGAAAGIAAGYWIADAGVRWVEVLSLILGAAVAAVVAMAWGSWRMGSRAGRPALRRRVIVLGAVAAVALGMHLGALWLARPSPLSSLDAARFAEVVRADAARLRDFDRELSRIRSTVESRSEALQGGRVLSPEDEAIFLDAWVSFVDLAFALDQIRLFHEDYYRLDLSRIERDRHIQSFTVTFAAELVLFEHASAILAMFDRNPNIARFLDVPKPERGLAKDSVARVREELAGLSDLSRVAAGQRYLDHLVRTYSAGDELASRGLGWLFDEVRLRSARITERGRTRLALESVASDVAPLGRRAMHAFFPVQKNVAEWMGDARVKHAGRYLINEERAAWLRAKLEPGDLIIARKNWYLSNLGLPGFWPHAILYVGTNEDLAQAFDGDEGVRAWLRELSGRDIAFSEYLASLHPAAWRARAEAAPEQALLLIEAVSEGVLMSSLPHALGDYAAALRPNLPARVKARAILQAFGYLGRPYDFDFDFATDHALVCTELVWRSYRPAAGEPGLVIDTVRVAGRETLPAQEIARLYAKERGREGAQLALVAFIEGLEREGDAVVADEARFVATVDRPKWDVAQP